MNFAQFLREPSTAKFAPLYKGAIEYTFRISKRSTSSHKSIDDSAPRTPKHQKRALSRRRGPGAHRGTRFNRPWYRPGDIKTLLSVRGDRHQDFEGLLWGWRIWQNPAHFISGPRLTPMRKKCPRANKGNPNCQDILPRTILSLADQNHRKGKRHTARGSPLEHPKGSFEPNGLAIGAWSKSNPKRSCHFRIKYPQLTPWPHLYGRDPWTVH